MIDAHPETTPADVPAPSLAELVQQVQDALERNDEKALVAIATTLKAPDLADLIELLAPEERAPFVQALGQSFDFDALSELDPHVRDQLSEALPNEVLARAVTELESDDAAYVIESLEADDRKDVLAQVPQEDRTALERALEYPEETAGRIMQADFVAVPPFWSVGQVIDHMREADDLPDSFSDIFVVDARHQVLGSIDLSRLLRTKRHVGVGDILETDRHVVLATEDQETVARQFERYGLRSAPVVDENQRLVGVVTVDDVVEVIEQEAEEDIRRLAGVGDENLSDSVRQIAPPRFSWLLVNLFTAILASAVIKVFDATIEQMVALAVLMPIVASMGGNAGTQTMTVAVRALATAELTPANVPRFVLRECAVGLINGLAFAVIMAVITVLWFGSNGLGLVIAGAMVINLLAAAVAGIFVPLVLHRYDLDPAVSSTVFVTTVTDVVGFFAFLGLATLWLR
ncbi:MAG: magnesium transporter [Hyphomicrobiales bacterium]|nr:magnesium transporter [Hyphomicrobiales bacterium]